MIYTQPILKGDILDVMFAEGWPVNTMRGIVLTDDRYMMLSRDWVENHLPKLWEAEMARRKMVPRVEANDCDDFAAALKSFVKDLHAKKSPEDAGLALGWFDYTIDNGIGHWKNGIIVNDGPPNNQQLAMIYFEPQLGNNIFKPLSQNERLTVRYFIS